MVKVATLRELLFADDCALNSNTEAEMHRCVNHFSRAYDNFGFTVCTKKTEAMHQPAPRKMYQEPNIFPKPTLHLEDSGRKCGNYDESAKTPN